MGELIYSAIMSLDGYTADEQGDFSWSAPDEEVHAFVNDLTRPIGTFLFGRRMYEVMLAWESADEFVGDSPAMRDFASLWRQTDKVVYSTSLPSVASARTRLERRFDPDAVQVLKASAERDLGVGGAHLAAQAMTAGLIDEYQLFVNPIVVGGGTPALPDDVRQELALVDEHRFGSGVMHLRYRTRP